jgi:hypothetical protein
VGCYKFPSGRNLEVGRFEMAVKFQESVKSFSSSDFREGTMKLCRS